MCSTNPSDIEDLNISLRTFKLHTVPTKCNKCKDSKPQIILRSKDAYCKTCFMANTLHKFKSILGKYRLVRPGDKVLIYHEGGHSSTALLNFIKSGLELDTPKKLKFIPINLLIIKNSCEKSEYFKYLDKVQEETKKFGFLLYLTSYNSFRNENKLLVTQNINEVLNKSDSSEPVQTSETLKDDIEKIYERRILIECAKKLDCKFIFTPEISTDVASQLLTNVSLGRGSHIPLDTGFCDTRNEHVTIMRPLRVFDIKELSLYNYFCGTNPVTISEKKSKEKSIHSLIEKFVHELQHDYPATVTTVLKTGDKLASQKLEENHICSICQGPIDESNDDLNTEKSIKFSTKLNKLNEKKMRGEICFACLKLEQYFDK